MLGPDEDDDRLIDAALGGNAEAFGRLVARYQDRLFGAMLHVVGSFEDARDVVQDAFVQAFVKLASFRRASAFYTWVYRIALNGAASRRRREKGKLLPGGVPKSALSLDGEAARACEPVDPGPAPAARLEQHDRAEQVRAALARLADEYRAVLVLREIDGCDYDTIADVLDLPVGTVRSRLHRARAQMRELLKEVLELEQK